MTRYSDNNEPHSKKWHERKRAIALSVGTCLLLGIVGFEMVRLTDQPQPVNSKNARIILPNPADVRHERNLSEMENRLYEMKRLLLVKDGAIENTRLQAIREKLRERDFVVSSLEKQREAQYQEIAREKEKLQELEKTVATLLETVELHKGTKEQGQEKLYKQIDEVRTQNTQEILKLHQQLAKEREIAETLQTSLIVKKKKPKVLNEPIRKVKNP